MHVFVRNQADVDKAVKAIRKSPGTVVYTLLDRSLGDHLRGCCADLGVPMIPLLDPLFKAMTDAIGPSRRHRPGKQYQTDTAYFQRVGAIDYAMALDDGATADRLRRADVILPGAAFTEESGIFVNTEGRPQMANRAGFPPGQAKENWAILRAASAALGKTLPYDSIGALRAAMFKAVPHLAQIDVAVLWWPVAETRRQAAPRTARRVGRSH